MFTGLVEEVGNLLDRRVSPAGAGLIRIRIGARRVLEDIQLGDSISVCGCCVTVAGLPPQGFEADLLPETLRRAVLGGIRIGCPVNLERAVPATGRFGGHLVTGHIDGTARLVAVTDGPGWRRLRIGLPTELAPLVAEKVSIAVDGVSLTVASVGPDWFEVELTPETLARTTFDSLGEQAEVNLEVDLLARHLARLANQGKLAGLAEFTAAVPA